MIANNGSLPLLLTINPRGHHLPCSQWFGTDKDYLYNTCIHYWDLQFLNNGIIIKTKIILLHANVTSADLIYPAILVFLPPKTFILFVFPIF